MWLQCVIRQNLRNFLRRFSLNTICRTTTMDSDDDMLYYSHQRLSNLIQQKGDKNAAIKNYLENLNYQPIKDFANDLEWFNVSEPLTFNKHLKGKIVVLDFFTYCCINCMHILPDLREIEQEFSIEDGLVVIGVHSAKFENEKISSNILAAVQRYNITHPVVNDYNSQIWRNCDINCWPTLLILGPNATPIVMLMGEGHKENLRLYIKCSLEFYKSKNQISAHQLPLESAYHLLPDQKGPLLFPGKITYFSDNTGELLAITDSGNHRVLIITPDGVIRHQIGGKIGFKDGNFDDCQFNSPQGIVFEDKSTLFVADTENHAIRKIDLNRGIVVTITGTGVQGHDRNGGKLWQEQEISSPWDVVVYKTADMDMTFYPNGNPPLRTVLIIAMAGTHQIWALFLQDTVWWKCKKYPAGTCICIAGSGREENRNNSYPQSAAFAQPSGLSLCKRNKEIYIADSESSSVRRLSLVDGKVTPVVGGDKNPQNLFAFGDEDGALFEAKLQHSLGLAISKDEQKLYVADTYNHKLKIVDIAGNYVITLPPLSANIFNEPGGLCVGNNNRVYVADTNNHCIKIVTITGGNTIKSIEKLDLIQSESVVKKSDNKLSVIDLKPINLNRKGGKLICKIHFVFKDGLKLTDDAPQKWYINLPNATWSCVPNTGNDIDNVDTVISVPTNFDNDKIDLVFNIVACTKDTCLPKNFIARLPINGKDNSEISIMNNIKIGLSPKDVVIL